MAIPRSKHLHVVQHVEFEGPAAIQDWTQRHGHTLTTTRLFLGEPLPQPELMDGLVVMGGPMSVNDRNDYPWLNTEQTFIAAAIAAGRPILGVCLGAQLIAATLGAQITANRYKEIGWFTIKPTATAADTVFGEVVSGSTEVFHWHGETFDIPAGAVPIASSDACTNQGFIYNGNVVALQFHLEVTAESAAQLIHHCGHELDDGEYVQSAEQIMADNGRFEALNLQLNGLLDRLFG